MDFNRIEAEERHIFKLWTLCRVCGQAGEKLQYCLDNYADLLDELYNIDLTKDDPAVHPQMVCQKCRLVLQHYLKKTPKTKGKARLPPLPALYTFNRHSEECDVCNRASGLLPKRKASLDSGEGESPAKVPRQEDTQPSSQLEGSATVEESAVQEKEVNEELGASQESDRANVLLQAIQGAIGDEAMTVNPEEAVDKPEQEGFTKYVYLNMIRRFKARGIKEDRSGDSIDVDRFRQKNFASAFLTCSLCKRLPLKPVTTECKHVFCEACISDWLNFGNVCPKCEEVIVELSDASEQLNHLYMLLDAPCSFAKKGCEAKLTPFEIHAHERDCPYNDKTESPSDSSDEEKEEQQPPEEVEVVPKVLPRKRKSLRFVTQRLAASRMEDLMDYLDRACKMDREDKVDVLFYMLREALIETHDARAKDVDRLWRNKKQPIHPVLKRKTRRLPHPPLPPPRPLSRRKGTPRKRGRPRKIPLPVQEAYVSSDQELEEEQEEAEEDLEKDATWEPPSSVGRRQSRTDPKVAEEEGDKETDEVNDSEKSNTVAEAEMESVVQEELNTDSVVVHVVTEVGEQPVEEASVTVQ